MLIVLRLEVVINNFNGICEEFLVWVFDVFMNLRMKFFFMLFGIFLFSIIVF